MEEEAASSILVAAERRRRAPCIVRKRDEKHLRDQKDMDFVMQTKTIEKE